MKNKHEKSEGKRFEAREKNMERHLSKELGINLEKREHKMNGEGKGEGMGKHCRMRNRGK